MVMRRLLSLGMGDKQFPPPHPVKTHVSLLANGTNGRTSHSTEAGNFPSYCHKREIMLIQQQQV